MATITKYAIEFRSGTFFQDLKAEHGGPRERAQRFDSMPEAEEFMHHHQWILLNGGAVVAVDARDTPESHFDPLGIDDDNHRGWIKWTA